MENNFCKICNSKLNKLFTKNILKKYKVAYYQCLNCGFLQTEKPYWLNEAYSEAITRLDVGLVNRNIQFSNIVEDILYEYFNKNAKFLDFAGGYGMFTRIMRDNGFDFFHEDKYCDNLFAKYFTINDLAPEDRKFELITSFELMEHIEDPFRELDYIFSITKSFLFSTVLISNKDIENWWYLGIEHGQHISFYTKKSLEKIAQKYNKVYYPNGNLHLITDKKNLKLFKNIHRYKKIIDSIKEKIIPSEKLPSRTWQDFEMIIKKEKNNA